MSFNKKHSKLGEIRASAVILLLLWVRLSRARLRLIVFSFLRRDAPDFAAAVVGN